MKRYCIALSLLMGATALSAQSTTKLSASKANDYGIVYNLPVTAIDIVVESEFNSKQPGEYLQYAKRYLDINDAVSAPSMTADIKSITLVPRGVPDTDNQWLMTFKGAPLTYVLVNDAGVPVAINTEKVPTPADVVMPEPIAAKPTALETDAARQAVTQEMTQSTSSAKRAQLAAQRVFQLRETRNDLLSGQADNMPPDGKSMQLMLDNLTAQEAALTAMFAGTEKSWTDVQTITFTPDDSECRNLVIARLSPTKGLVGPDDLSGEPIYLNLDIITEGRLPADEKGLPKKFPKDGIAYTIPGQAQVTISFRGKTIATELISLAQLGVQYGLDPRTFNDRRNPAFAVFDPITGALVSVGTME